MTHDIKYEEKNDFQSKFQRVTKKSEFCDHTKKISDHKSTFAK